MKRYPIGKRYVVVCLVGKWIYNNDRYKAWLENSVEMLGEYTRLEILKVASIQRNMNNKA